MASQAKFDDATLIGRTAWLVRRIACKLWVRAAAFSVAGLIVALLGAYLGPSFKDDFGLKLVAGSVDDLLNILATSMLAVTTFSLSIMVSALSAATSNATPRSTQLLLEDATGQNALATFIGSFLFAIVGIVGLAAGIYEDNGRIILFAATVVVIVIIIATLLGWIEQLRNFGRVADTIYRIADAALPPARQWGCLPRLGACPAAAIPAGALAIAAQATGHLTHIDVEKLSKLAEEHDLVIHLSVLPGAFVTPGKALAYVVGRLETAMAEALAQCFSVEIDRRYDQDPRFGLIVLSEIASRALSPAVNDPGTAIAVLEAGTRVLLAYEDASTERSTDTFARLHAPDLSLADLFDDFFNPIARDGASVMEVQMRLQAILQVLAQSRTGLFAEQARKHAVIAARRAQAALADEYDRMRMAERAAWAQ